MYIAGACIFGIIISKFDYWQEPYLNILLEVDKGSKISLHSTDLPLCLTVNLRMKGDRKAAFDIKEIAKQ